MEMDVDSDEETSSKKDQEKSEAEKVREQLPPLPPSLDNVLIRKDYNPKSKSAAAQAPSGSKPLPESYVISPITGEKIPADKLAEHMRYSLLDPRWVEQRDKHIQEKTQQEEVYAVGSAIESSLKNLAERRTDIFGMGDEETSIGRKIGEKEDEDPLNPGASKSKGPVAWDGFHSTIETTQRSARSNVTMEDQRAHMQKLRNIELERERIGPSFGQSGHGSTISQGPKPPSLAQQQHYQQQAQQAQMQAQQQAQAQHAHHMQMQGMHHGGPPGPPQGLLHHPHQVQQQQQQQHDFMMQGGGGGGLGRGFVHPGQLPGPPPPPMFGMPPQQHGPPGMHPGMPLPPHMMMPGATGDMLEPPYKKVRPGEEGSFIGEEDFLASVPSPNVTIQIQVPASQEKPEWKLNGQMLTFTLPYKDTFTVVKGKISEATGMPPGKQKLQYEGIFVKDSNSLAFYNLPNGALIVLGLKERGGRKY